jgi:hypothetical protein
MEAESSAWDDASAAVPQLVIADSEAHCVFEVHAQPSNSELPPTSLLRILSSSAAVDLAASTIG